MTLMMSIVWLSLYQTMEYPESNIYPWIGLVMISIWWLTGGRFGFDIDVCTEYSYDRASDEMQCHPSPTC